MKFLFGSIKVKATKTEKAVNVKVEETAEGRQVKIKFEGDLNSSESQGYISYTVLDFISAYTESHQTEIQSWESDMKKLEEFILGEK